jgi:predicted tellurium resistance membrane protein TerC
MTSRVRGRFRDLALCVLTATGIVTVAFAYGMYGGDIKWLALAGNTLLIFWYGFRPFQRHRRCRTVILGLAGALTAHLVIFIYLLIHVRNWPLLWYIPSDFFEVAVLFTLFDRLVYGASALHRDKPSDQTGSRSTPR